MINARNHSVWGLCIVFLTTSLVAAPPASQPAYLAPDNFDLKALLGDPPADGSPQQQKEIDALLDLQAHRTAADEARCKSEEEVDVFAFDTVLGPTFKAEQLPITAKLMDDANHQLKVLSNAGKIIWNRKRPPTSDQRIHPCVAMEKSASYPSGHATRGMVWAILLSEIFPDQRDALMARGKQIGDDRFLAGMHYPSDVAAGQKLGAEIAKRMLADPDFRARLDKAKAECHSSVKPAAAN